MRTSSRSATASKSPAREPNWTYTVERATPARCATASSVTLGSGSDDSISMVASSTV